MSLFLLFNSHLFFMYPSGLGKLTNICLRVQLLVGVFGNPNALVDSAPGGKYLLIDAMSSDRKKRNCCGDSCQKNESLRAPGSCKV